MLASKYDLVELLAVVDYVSALVSMEGYFFLKKLPVTQGWTGMLAHTGRSGTQSPSLACILTVTRALNSCVVCRSLYVVEVMKGRLCLPRVGEVGDAGSDVLCAALYAGCCGVRALFAGGVGGAGGNALWARMYAGSSGRWTLFAGGVVGTDSSCDVLYARGCEG